MDQAESSSTMAAGAAASEEPNQNGIKKEEPQSEGGSVFSYSGFNKLFAGSLCGAFADRIYFAALFAAANVIYINSAPENQKGRIQIVATIPLLLLYGLSGSLVDSMDRRRLLTLVKGIKAVAVLLFVPLLWQAIQIDVDMI